MIFYIIIIIFIFINICSLKKGCRNKNDHGIILKLIDLNNINKFIIDELKYFRTNNIETKFINNNDIKKFINKIIINNFDKSFKIADRGIWLRYYNSDKFINPYEYWHYDRKRYSLNSNQYRLVINLFVNANSKFCYKLKCSNNNEKCIKSESGLLIGIEANEGYHKVIVENGERLVLMVDIVDNEKRGICGNLFSIYDYVWLNIIKNYFISPLKK